MKSKTKKILALSGLLGLALTPFPVRAGDLDDNISEATEESVAADENLGNKDVNISFIVTDALAQAKSRKSEEALKGKDNKTLTHFDDGENDSNENSIVVGAGSRVDKVTNIVIQK